jgi:phosphoribosylamine--glycine ligase
MNILIIGSGAREHAIIKALAKSPLKPKLYCFGTTNNPGIVGLVNHIWIGDITCVKSVVTMALQWHIDLAIIGPEAPLEKGLGDAFLHARIATVGPTKKLAQIETSKAFTRKLMQKHQIKGSIRYKNFHNLDGVEDFLHALGNNQYVVKADGLMGGKGVKVAGEHLHSFEETLSFCNQLIKLKSSFLIEEKLVGQEFSLLCFSDGKRMIPMPLVQDHKRSFIQDTGPNTGGMGSYSLADHSLPFLTNADLKSALSINQAILDALHEECEEPYRGILYGSFMATQSGIHLIECNARFGDPEAINLLALIDTDFAALCYDLAEGQLSSNQVAFKPLATVCKYAVPLGYPDASLKNTPIDVSLVGNPETLYFAGVEDVQGALFATGSRTIATLGVAATLAEAQKIAETAVCQIQGALFHREDIGTENLINSRIEMMHALRLEVSA